MAATITLRAKATLYLLGYNISCYKRYQVYLEDYADEGDIAQRAFASYLKQAGDLYRISSEPLAEELGSS